jgi:metallophosphoesterase superfamily enzyme
MKYRVINDLHLGVNRTGGTTQSSLAELRAYTQRCYSDLLGNQKRVIINGDMFDTYQVPTSELLTAYVTTARWLETTGESLHLIPGNHDLAKNSVNLSSFEFLAQLLVARYPDKVKYCQGAHWIDESQGLFSVSHVPNQDLFDHHLANLPQGVKTLLLHCNYDNVFACDADHSLNLSRATAKELTKTMTIVMGHEHQGRTSLGDKVVVVGNQFPTSVSDCRAHGDGQKDGRKYCLDIEGEDMELVPTWSRSEPFGGYAEVEWDVLADYKDSDEKFVRVTGKVAATQGAEVIKAISIFRQSSKAFVITNAVKVEQIDSIEDLAESVEDIRSVNIIDLLMEQLDEAQQLVVKRLLSEAA